VIRQFLLSCAIGLGSAFSFIPAIHAQTTNPAVNQLLGETNQFIDQTNQFIQNEVEPEARRYQNYLQQLYYACAQGYAPACQEYSIRMQNQQRYREHLTQQYETWIENRRY